MSRAVLLATVHAGPRYKGRSKCISIVQHTERPCYQVSFFPFWFQLTPSHALQVLGQKTSVVALDGDEVFSCKNLQFTKLEAPLNTRKKVPLVSSQGSVGLGVGLSVGDSVVKGAGAAGLNGSGATGILLGAGVTDYAHLWLPCVSRSRRWSEVYI